MSRIGDYVLMGDCHMALVLSCTYLAAAQRGLRPLQAHDFAEFALERLLSLDNSLPSPGLTHGRG